MASQKERTNEEHNMKNRNPILVVVIFLFAVISGIYTVVHYEPHYVPRNSIEPIPIDSRTFVLHPNQEIKESVFVAQGSVIDERHLPFESAEVVIQKADMVLDKIIADSYGRFQIQLTEGAYVVSATASDAIKASSQIFQVGADHSPDIIIHLLRSVFLKGHVTNAESTPIARAKIELHGIRKDNESVVRAIDPTRSTVHYETYSDNAGFYLFPSLLPGSYSLKASATDYLTHYLPEISAYENTRDLLLNNNAELSIRVIDQNNDPIHLANVELLQTRTKGIFIMMLQTNDKGLCSFSSIKPGFYRIQAHHKDYQQIKKSSLDVELSTDNESHLLILNKPGYAIHGSVLEKSTRSPIPDFGLCLYLKDREGGSEIQYCTTEKDGKFIFTDISKGFYLIKERDEFQNRESKFTTTHWNPPMEFIVQVIDKDIYDLEILAVKKSGISGRVFTKDNKPVEGAFVFTIRGQAEQRTDQNGYYFIPSLKMYSDKTKLTKVYAIHERYGFGVTEGVKYSPGNIATNVDIILNSLIQVRGKIENEQGKPIPNANLVFQTITPKKSQNPVYQKNTVSNEKGEYQFNNVIPNYAKLFASAHGYIEQKKYLESTDDADQQIDFVLIRKEDKKKYSICGYVIDVNNSPVSHAQVDLQVFNPIYEEVIQSVRTDGNGYFAFQNINDTSVRYLIKASTTAFPYLTKKVYDVNYGDEIWILLDFAPKKLTVHLDESKTQFPVRQGAIFSFLLAKDQETDFYPISKLLQRNETALIHTEYIYTPGDYTIYVQGSGTSARQSIEINAESPESIDLHLQLSKDPNEVLYVSGRVINENLTVTKTPFIVRCMMLRPTLQFVDQKYVNFSSNPNRLQEFFIKIPVDGVYEFIYSLQNGTIIKRNLMELIYAAAEPSPSGIGKLLYLPDLVIPEKESTP
jgi:protocatechuate 3,4-dioxygenase beta subunit